MCINLPLHTLHNQSLKLRLFVEPVKLPLQKLVTDWPN